MSMPVSTAYVSCCSLILHFHPRHQSSSCSHLKKQNNRLSPVTCYKQIPLGVIEISNCQNSQQGEWKDFRLSSTKDQEDWINQLKWSTKESVNQTAPRILVLYGSLRKGSLSKALAYEAARLLERFGADVRVYQPYQLPILNPVHETHPKVAEFRQLFDWSEGQVWCSPEHHGSISSVFKNQLDWYTFPPTGKTVALLQVQGGSLSCQAVTHMLSIARSLSMFIVPMQLVIPETYKEFHASTERMNPSSYRDRLVQVMEELYKLTCMTQMSIKSTPTTFR